MRPLKLFALCSLLAGMTGCGACTFPFSVESDGQVVIPLGAVGDCTSADDGTYPEDGEPDEDGNLTTYHHVIEGSNCKMTSSWKGSLVDMAKAKADTEKSLKEQGLDPESVEVEITTFTPKVQVVTLRDDGTDGSPVIDAPGLLAYHGFIGVADVDDVITATFEAPGDTDPLKPNTDVNVPDSVLEAVNKAYADGTKVPATGDADCLIDAAQLAPVQAAVRPALVVDFKLKLEGEADLGGGG